jgi:hypothetical protein
VFVLESTPLPAAVTALVTGPVTRCTAYTRATRKALAGTAFADAGLGQPTAGDDGFHLARDDRAADALAGQFELVDQAVYVIPWGAGRARTPVVAVPEIGAPYVAGHLHIVAGGYLFAPAPVAPEVGS